MAAIIFFSRFIISYVKDEIILTILESILHTQTTEEVVTSYVRDKLFTFIFSIKISSSCNCLLNRRAQNISNIILSLILLSLSPSVFVFFDGTSLLYCTININDISVLYKGADFKEKQLYRDLQRDTVFVLFYKR